MGVVVLYPHHLFSGTTNGRMRDGLYGKDAVALSLEASVGRGRHLTPIDRWGYLPTERVALQQQWKYEYGDCRALKKQSTLLTYELL